MSTTPLQMFDGCYVVTRDGKVEGPYRDISSQCVNRPVNRWSLVDLSGQRIHASELDDLGRWSMQHDHPASKYDAVAVFATHREAKEYQRELELRGAI